MAIYSDSERLTMIESSDNGKRCRVLLLKTGMSVKILSNGH